MPIYVIKCDHCGLQEDIYRSVAQYNDLPEHCGEAMHRVIRAPYVTTDIQPYKSMVTGEMIGGRAQHREHLKQHRLIELGNDAPKTSKPPEAPPGLREDIARVVYQMT
jgi:hypothetical protein